MAKKNQAQQDIRSEAEQEAEQAVAQEQEQAEETVEFRHAQSEPAQPQPDPMQEQLDMLNNRYLRLQADFENFKKRNSATAVKMYNEGLEEVIVAVLPTLDYLDMAIAAQKDESQRKGIELVKKTLLDTLAKFNVEQIEALGQEFDPNIHEAVMNRDDPEHAGMVVEVLKTGYRRNQTVLRHPMVAVGQ